MKNSNEYYCVGDYFKEIRKLSKNIIYIALYKLIAPLKNKVYLQGVRTPYVHVMNLSSTACLITVKNENKITKEEFIVIKSYLNDLIKITKNEVQQILLGDDLL